MAMPHRPDGASAVADVERELLDVAARWRDAIVANDADRIAGFVTDDWVLVDPSGISPGTRLLALIASGELTHSAMDIRGPTRVRVLGPTALLTARIVHTAHHRGQRIDADEWTTDVFVRDGDRWLCALTHYAAALPTAPDPPLDLRTGPA
jgi:ketosteroid isomerase-like protein